MPSDAPRETTVEELANKLKSADAFVLLDVREPWELAVARIQDARLETVPISRLARGGLDVLPASAREPQAEIYVLCHHGIRSADVTRWLASQGWQNVFSVAGGIAEYARKIDRSVGSY
jgi:rhodanese-related sulfurtransferase